MCWFVLCDLINASFSLHILCVKHILYIFINIHYIVEFVCSVLCAVGVCVCAVCKCIKHVVALIYGCAVRRPNPSAPTADRPGSSRSTPVRRRHPGRKSCTPCGSSSAVYRIKLANLTLICIRYEQGTRRELLRYSRQRTPSRRSSSLSCSTAPAARVPPIARPPVLRATTSVRYSSSHISH